MSAGQTLSRGPEEHAAVVVLHGANIHAQLKIAELLLGGQMPRPISPKHLVERCEVRLALRDEPLSEIRRPVVQHLPIFLVGQLADSQITKTNRIDRKSVV